MKFPITIVYLVLFSMVAYLFWGLTHQPTHTIQAKPECHTHAGLPYDVVVCPNRHAYHIEDGRWVDMGQVTPLPPTPRGRGIEPRGNYGSPTGSYSSQLSALAHRYTGSRGHNVYCDDESVGTYGWTDLRQISLNWNFCKPLLALMGGVMVAPAKQGVGLITLLHEATHIRWPWATEAQVECFAYHRVDHAARQLPIPNEWRRRIVAYAQADSRNLQRQPRYHSRCPL